MSSTSSGYTVSDNATEPNYMDYSYAWYNYPFMDIIVILFTAICVAGVCCNLTVIFVFASSKVLHTVTNLYILNLAFADLLRLLVSVPFLVQILYFSYPFSEGTCKFLHYATPVTYMVSVYTLLLICISRYFAIVKPGKFVKLRNKPVTVAICVGLWILCLLFNIEIPIEAERYELHITPKPLNPVYVCIASPPFYAVPWIEFLIGYMIPIVPIFYISAAMLRHVYKQQVRMYLESRNQVNRITIMFLCIAFAVTVLLLPFFVYNIVLQYIVRSMTMNTDIVVLHAVWLATYTMYTANSAINPFIYNYFSREFHEAFLNLTPFRVAYRGRSVPNHRDAELSETEVDHDGDVLMQTY